VLVSVDLEHASWTLNPEFQLLRHLCQFVRPGARCLALAGPWTANAIAFANADGSHVVVAANPLPEARELVISHAGTTVRLMVEPGAFETVVFG